MSAPKLVLIAEDDPADVFFLRQALKEKCPGVEVREVRDGQEAVDYLSGAGPFADRARFPLPDHVFLDVKMPRLSGLEVLEWMRGPAGLPAIGVVVLSGSQLAGDIDAARRLGADYLVKPVEYGALLELIERYCRRFFA